jgi:hypothetical protein
MTSLSLPPTETGARGAERREDGRGTSSSDEATETAPRAGLPGGRLRFRLMVGGEVDEDPVDDARVDVERDETIIGDSDPVSGAGLILSNRRDDREDDAARAGRGEEASPSSSSCSISSSSDEELRSSITRPDRTLRAMLIRRGTPSTCAQVVGSGKVCNVVWCGGCTAAGSPDRVFGGRINSS